MLEMISWTKYFEIVAVGSACWYGFLATAYYRPEIAALFNKRGVGSKAVQDGPGAGPTVKTYWTPEGRMPYTESLPSGTGADSATRREDDEAELLPLPEQILSTPTDPASAIIALQQFIGEAQGLMIELAATAQSRKLKEVIAELVTSFPDLRDEPERTTALNFLRRESRTTCNVIWQDDELEALLPAAEE